MKLSPDFQLSSDLSALEIEKTQAWLREGVTAFEKKEPNLGVKYFTEDATIIIGSLGSVKNHRNLEQFLIWQYRATQTAQVNIVLKSLQLAVDRLVYVLDGECSYANGLPERFSWRVNATKNINSDKITSATLSDTGSQPDIFPLWCKKAGLPAFDNSVQ